MITLRFLRFCLIGCTAWGLYVSLDYFCRKQTEGFALTSILSHRPFDPAWQTRPLSPSEQEELTQALSQKYHLFGRGGQCFAFVSDDDRYVIKFFKQKTYTVPFWHHWIPIPYLFDRYKNKKRCKRQDKLQRDFSSYKIAFEEMHEQTGLLFIHLNPTRDLQCRLTLIDRLHIAHQVDLDHMDFIVQRKAQLISPTILDLLQSQEIERAKAVIDQICTLTLSRCHKGLEDWDPEVRTNCGLVKGQLIKIDVGRFIPNAQMRTPDCCLSELIRVITPFQDWLRPISPCLADYCDEAITKALGPVISLSS